MDCEEKREIIDRLEELALEDKYSAEHKKRLFSIIMDLKIGTSLQRERYILYYGLNINKKRRYNYTEIAKMYKCTPSNIKGSVMSMRRALIRLIPDEIKKFENIIKTVK